MLNAIDDKRTAESYIEARLPERPIVSQKSRVPIPTAGVYIANAQCRMYDTWYRVRPVGIRPLQGGKQTLLIDGPFLHFPFVSLHVRETLIQRQSIYNTDVTGETLTD